MERFSRGRLAFSVPPDSTIDPATRLPAVDSTLSEAQREAIAEYVARRLTRQAAGEEAEIDSSDWQNVARRAAALLTPGPDSSNTLTLAVTSGDFNENGTLEYLVLAKRSFEKVVATLAEADSSQRTRFRGGCIGQMGDFHVEGASADSLALVCVRNQKQAAAFAGRMVDGHWKELFSQVLSRSRYSRGVSLQALDVNGDEVPELLSKQGQEGGARYEVFTYKDGTFKRVGYFGHGH